MAFKINTTNLTALTVYAIVFKVPNLNIITESKI